MNCFAKAVKKMFIDECNFNSFVEGTAINYIIVDGFEYIKQQTDSIDGTVELFLQGAELEEVAVADIDDVASVGKFATNTQNQLIIIVAKADVSTEVGAKNYIQGFLFNYDLLSLEYSTQDAQYTLEGYNSNGVQIASMTATALSTINTTIEAYDENHNLNTGYQYFIARRAVSVSS